MTMTEAKKMLKKLEKNGYVAYHSGLVTMDCTRYGRQKINWGVNVDGDGHNGRLFGCPRFFWDIEQVLDFLKGGK